MTNFQFCILDKKKNVIIPNSSTISPSKYTIINHPWSTNSLNPISENTTSRPIPIYNTRGPSWKVMNQATIVSGCPDERNEAHGRPRPSLNIAEIKDFFYQGRLTWPLEEAASVNNEYNVLLDTDEPLQGWQDRNVISRPQMIRGWTYAYLPWDRPPNISTINVWIRWSPMVYSTRFREGDESAWISRVVMGSRDEIFQGGWYAYTRLLMEKNEQSRRRGMRYRTELNDGLRDFLWRTRS